MRKIEGHTLEWDPNIKREIRPLNSERFLKDKNKNKKIEGLSSSYLSNPFVFRPKNSPYI